MRRVLALLLLAFAANARAQPLLDPPAVPSVSAETRSQYAAWLLTNTPRVFAASANGQSGWFSGGASLEEARPRALQLCASHGGTDCRLYAEDLSIVWPGREWRPLTPPGPFVDTMNTSLAPDGRFLWHGPAGARGVVVWAHGTAGDVDARGLQPPPFLRAFNNAGFDVVRFDRAPMADTPLRAAGWLRDGLRLLRRDGYRMVVAAGQSRGGWTSLEMLDTPGSADVVIATSPAAHGTGSSTNLAAQDDQLRAIVDGAPASQSRVAFIQFAADPYIADAATRVRLMERLRPRTGALLLVDRPPGFSGHLAAGGQAFSVRFAACLLRFTVDADPPSDCGGPE